MKEVNVTTFILDDQKTYCVLDRILKNEETYYILFQEDQPDHVLVRKQMEQDGKKILLPISLEETKMIIDEFYERHPSFTEVQ